MCLGLLNEQNLKMDVDWKSKHTDAGNIWPTRFDPNASSYTHTHTDIREWNIDCNLTLVLCVRFDSDAGGRSPPNQFGQKIKKNPKKATGMMIITCNQLSQWPDGYSTYTHSTGYNNILRKHMCHSTHAIFVGEILSPPLSIPQEMMIAYLHVPSLNRSAEMRLEVCGSSE